jgi:hypothetical protein
MKPAIKPKTTQATIDIYISRYPPGQTSPSLNHKLFAEFHAGCPAVAKNGPPKRAALDCSVNSAALFSEHCRHIADALYEPRQVRKACWPDQTFSTRSSAKPRCGRANLQQTDLVLRQAGYDLHPSANDSPGRGTRGCCRKPTGRHHCCCQDPGLQASQGQPKDLRPADPSANPGTLPWSPRDGSCRHPGRWNRKAARRPSF